MHVKLCEINTESTRNEIFEFASSPDPDKKGIQGQIKDN